jgi:hypothetical protein
MRATPLAEAQTLELVQWIAARSRTYADTIEAWGSHCPRSTIWEDALTDGLVAVERSVVVLTSTGRAALDAARA